jgi:hypothetical protein
MFRNFIQWLDGLFWETRIITTTTTTYTVEEETSNNNNINPVSRLVTNNLPETNSTIHIEDRKSADRINFNDGVMIHIEGIEPFRIPDKVMTRPLITNRGMVNRKFHPGNEQFPFIVLVDHEKEHKLFVNGQRVSRQSVVDGVRRNTGMDKINACTKFVDRYPTVGFKTTYLDLNILIFLNREYLYMDVNTGGKDRFRLYQENFNQFNESEKGTNYAYSLVRSLLLDFFQEIDDIVKYDEDLLVMSILPYLLKCKK